MVKNKNEDNLFIALLNDQNGFSTVIERTEFGKHVDHISAFYGSLDDQQKEEFLHAAHPDDQLRAFESLLDSGQLNIWQGLKDEADLLGGSFNPQNKSQLEIAASSLRTMMDQYPASDPVAKAIQDHAIDRLGGMDCVKDIIQQSMDPELGAASLALEVQQKLLTGLDDKFSCTETVGPNGEACPIEVFFNGEPIELIGTADGGVKLPEDLPGEGPAPGPEQPSSLPDMSTPNGP